jgi:gamma-glutamylcyclotransferase (GGCT)/AIG2-like uncharacterized protein YtfP
MMADGMVDEVISGLPALPEDVPDDRLLPVFAFGEKPDPGFVERLLEHPVRAEPARLPAYRVDRLAMIDWPILVPDDQEIVEGRLFLGLDAEDLRRLDAYQGVGEGLYRRTAVSVQLGETGNAAEAFIYLPTDRTLRRHSIADPN